MVAFKRSRRSTGVNKKTAVQEIIFNADLYQKPSMQKKGRFLNCSQYSKTDTSKFFEKSPTFSPYGSIGLHAAFCVTVATIVGMHRDLLEEFVKKCLSLRHNGNNEVNRVSNSRYFSTKSKYYHIELQRPFKNKW